MSCYNPVSFFFVLIMCALIAAQLGVLLAGSQLVWLVLAAEIYAFYRLYTAFKQRSSEQSAWYSAIFGAFVFLTIASVVLLGMISPIGGIISLIGLIT